ncbi:cyclin-dependent kinase inhibitor 7 [Sesbania bispinosa]|nr:cyclin-dependent kinase inhibitor 7 [Sesbania bispinosa]
MAQVDVRTGARTALAMRAASAARTPNKRRKINNSNEEQRKLSTASPTFHLKTRSGSSTVVKPERETVLRSRTREEGAASMNSRRLVVSST